MPNYQNKTLKKDFALMDLKRATTELIHHKFTKEQLEELSKVSEELRLLINLKSKQ